jgi:hypothetical protein
MESLSLSKYIDSKEFKLQSEFSKNLRKILENNITQGILTFLTIYILFADDIKMITTTQDSDPIFSCICISIMFIFFIEFLISSFVVDQYVLGFYFWLDLISIISMVLDIHWFYEFLINSVSDGSSNAKSIAAIAKAGRGAKIGTRAVRILRILRIIRLVRITKLYKASEKILEKNIGKVEKKFMVDDKTDVPEESKVGRKLSDLTTKRVIILVLSMMIGIILFNASFYYNIMTSMDYGIKIFEEFDSSDDPNFNLTFNIFISEHLNITTPILYAQISNLTFGKLNDTLNLRPDEKIIAESPCDNLDLPRTDVIVL